MRRILIKLINKPSRLPAEALWAAVRLRNEVGKASQKSVGHRRYEK